MAHRRLLEATREIDGEHQRAVFTRRQGAILLPGVSNQSPDPAIPGLEVKIVLWLDANGRLRPFTMRKAIPVSAQGERIRGKHPLHERHSNASPEMHLHHLGENVLKGQVDQRCHWRVKPVANELRTEVDTLLHIRFPANGGRKACDATVPPIRLHEPVSRIPHLDTDITLPGVKLLVHVVRAEGPFKMKLEREQGSVGRLEPKAREIQPPERTSGILGGKHAKASTESRCPRPEQVHGSGQSGRTIVIRRTLPKHHVT